MFNHPYAAAALLAALALSPKQACRLIGAAGALALLATTAHATPCYGAPDEICSPRAFSAYAQVDDDDEDDEDEDDEEDGDVDLDDNDDRDFEYDEDEGSFLVDLENCEPGKYWMMDQEDGVPLPCK